MKMTMRWFGSGLDTVSLEQIRQVPGVTGVVAALHNLPAGEPWPLEALQALKAEIEAAGLTMECIESVNVHEDIKIGLPSRDKWIAHYITSIRNCAAVGVRCICYNFMPVFDWTRTDLAFRLPDGSTCLLYDNRAIAGKSADDMFRACNAESNGYAMPGWEANRIPHIKACFEQYADVSEEMLWENLAYFLRAVLPVCEEVGVNLAIHPDDPPWSIFGLPRIIKNSNDYRRLIAIAPSLANGITFCTGSLGASAENDLPAMIAELAPRIHFAHLRNVARGENGFNETAHRSADGSLDMAAIVQALVDNGFDGYIRPDHGRMIWGEVARPGYGLFDRALGATYLSGLFEMARKHIE